MQNKKTYKVFLDGEEIGTTKLELGDPPMGVVAGKFYAINNIDLQFWKDYCNTNNIHFEMDEFVGVIQTMEIPCLNVFNKSGAEIKGVSTNIGGTKDDLFIAILGVPYPFYEEEFPDHVNTYHSNLQSLRDKDR